MPKRTCDHCGEPNHRSPSAKYCTDRCRDAARRKRKPRNHKAEKQRHFPARTCEHCGQQYRPTYEPQRYCGKSCSAHATALATGRQPGAPTKRTIARIRQAKARQGRGPSSRIFTEGTCCHCGERFITTYQHRYCSERCKTRARHHATAGTPGAYVQRHVIYQRDGWVCQLCGKHVDPTLRFPDKHAATLDHIIPLAIGGDHTHANLQLAHFTCNSRKQAGGSQQLRLIG